MKIDKLLVSTVQRVPREKVNRDFKCVYLIDYNSGQVINHIDSLRPGWSLISETGNSHGARGLCVFNNLLYIADWDGRLSWYSLDDFSLLGSRILDNVHGVHIIREHNDLLHIVSTKTDSVVRLDKNNNIVQETKISEASDIIDDFISRADLRINKSELRDWGNNRLHFNSICWDENGDEYHVYHNIDVIFNFTKKEFVWHSDPLFKQPHDIEIKDGYLYTNSSGTFSSLRRNLKNNNVKIFNTNESSISKNNPWNLYGMTRGLYLGDTFLLTGNTPFSIMRFNLKTLKKTKEIAIETSEAQSIFDICIIGE